MEPVWLREQEWLSQGDVILTGPARMGRMSSRKYRRIISHVGKKEKLLPPKFREEYGGEAQCLELLV